MSMKCQSCDKPLTSDEVKECYDVCFECNLNYLVGRLAYSLRMARITFEELLRKLIKEVDS